MVHLIVTVRLVLADRALRQVVCYKGARGAGHMGVDRVTAQNIKVVMVDVERNLIAINGAVPGGKGSLVMIKESRKQ
jgi:large subunit ribosomal protein L3